MSCTWLASGIAVLLALSCAAGFFVLPSDAAGFSLIGAAFVAALLLKVGKTALYEALRANAQIKRLSQSVADP